MNGLLGTGLVLQNSGGDDLAAPPPGGTFTFAARVAEGMGYSVTVRSQHSSPSQTCSVAPATAAGPNTRADVPMAPR